MMLTTAEYANFWGVAPKTVRRWIEDKRIHAVQPYPGAPYRIPEEELYTFHPSDARLEQAKKESVTESRPLLKKVKPWQSSRNKSNAGHSQPASRHPSNRSLLLGLSSSAQASTRGPARVQGFQ